MRSRCSSRRRRRWYWWRSWSRWRVLIRSGTAEQAVSEASGRASALALLVATADRRSGRTRPLETVRGRHWPSVHRVLSRRGRFWALRRSAPPRSSWPLREAESMTVRTDDGRDVLVAVGLPDRAAAPESSQPSVPADGADRGGAPHLAGARRPRGRAGCPRCGGRRPAGPQPGPTGRRGVRGLAPAGPRRARRPGRARPGRRRSGSCRYRR